MDNTDLTDVRTGAIPSAAKAAALALEDMARDLSRMDGPLDPRRVNDAILGVPAPLRPGTLVCAVNGYNKHDWQSDSHIPGVVLEGVVLGPQQGLLKVNANLYGQNDVTNPVTIYTYPVTGREAEILPKLTCPVPTGTADGDVGKHAQSAAGPGPSSIADASGSGAGSAPEAGTEPRIAK